MSQIPTQLELIFAASNLDRSQIDWVRATKEYKDLLAEIDRLRARLEEDRPLECCPACGGKGQVWRDALERIAAGYDCDPEIEAIRNLW